MGAFGAVIGFGGATVVDAAALWPNAPSSGVAQKPLRKDGTNRVNDDRILHDMEFWSVKFEFLWVQTAVSLARLLVITHP